MDRHIWEITRIVPETGEASSFCLKKVAGPDLKYEAGQFLTFLFPGQAGEERRSYSFSSTPGLDPEPAITVKRVPNGRVSRLLLDRARPGGRLEALLPAGRFTLETSAEKSRQIFFIAAGSGISPVFSLLKKILHDEPLSSVLLIDQNRDEDSVIFAGRLAELASHHAPRFSWISLLSNPKSAGAGPERLNNEKLEKLVSENLHRGRDVLFYICGPESFMRMAFFTLNLLGIPPERIKREHFSAVPLTAAQPVANSTPYMVQVDYFGQEYSFQTRYPDTILQSALKQNLPLPYSCRGGRCSTCMAKCLAGTVRLATNEVLTDTDLQAGWTLPCVGYAETDLNLRYGP